MNADLAQAVKRLKAVDYTCVLCCGEQTYTSRQRGVKPLLDLLDNETPCSDFSAADRVVGKAAAFLYLLLKVRAVYAGVISTPAKQLLETGGVTVYSEQEVPAIRNRAGTGFCPMETAVWHMTQPTEALAAIRFTLAQLAQRTPMAESVKGNGL